VWVDLGPATAVADGAWLLAELEGLPVAVVRVGAVLYAFEDRCTHDGGSLAGGELEGTEVVCPRHGARFSVCSGAVLAPPAYEPLLIFAVREEAGRILVQSSPSSRA